MSKTNKLSQRFAELTKQAEAVLATKRFKEGAMISGDFVDANMLIAWETKARHLLAMTCGNPSPHYSAFNSAGSAPYSTNGGRLLGMIAVFEAAREDYDGGYFNSVRSLIQAEVFSDELDQATELLKAGYISAAAVIAGVVLETNMRQLCNDNGIEPASLNKMNDELTKAGIYSLLVKKQITALADIRNNAAHGKPENFDEKDVREMITKVGDFIVTHAS